jgi:hypothetical protein
MRIRKGVMAAGIVLASAGVPLATAGAAYAAPTQFVDGVITGPHTFTWVSGPIFVGEVLLPNAPFYSSKVPVTGISVNPVTHVTTVTTGFTFLPLNRMKETTVFTVIPPTT